VIDANVSEVILNESSTFVRMNDGSLQVMGRNNYGQLGTGDTSSVYSPTTVIDANISEVISNESSTFVLMNDGSLQVFGSDQDGQLGGVSGWLPKILEPTEVTTGLLIPQEDLTTTTTHFINISMAINGQWVGSSTTDANISNLSMHLDESNFSGKVDEVNFYDSALSRYQFAEIHRLESIPPREVYEYHPVAYPTNISVPAGRVELDQLRIFDRAVAEQKLVELHYTDLSPAGRQVSMRIELERELAPLTEALKNAEEAYAQAVAELENLQSLESEAHNRQDEASFNYWEANSSGDQNASALAKEELDEAEQELADASTNREKGEMDRDQAESNRTTAKTNLENAEKDWLGDLILLPESKQITDSATQSMGTDLFVARWLEDGTFDHLTTASGAKEDDSTQGNAILSLEEDQTMVGGSYGSAILWDDLNRSGSGTQNAFIAKLDDSLNPVWITDFNGSETSEINTLALGEDKDLLGAGTFAGTIDHPSSPLSSTGGTDAWLIKLDPFGELISQENHGGLGDDRATGIGALKYGGLLLAGTFEGSVDFYGDSKFTAVSAGEADGFILRYDYQAYIPEQVFNVEVAQGSEGSLKYFVNGLEAPDITLLRGVPYTFRLDGNSTLDHPFYFGTFGEGGDGYETEYLDGVSKSRATTGELSFSPNFNTPPELFYLCGKHRGMGGRILIPGDERPRSALTFAAIDQGGNFIEDGNWTVLTDEGTTIRNGQSILADRQALLAYTPPDGYYFTGWSGNIPDDINASVQPLEVNLTEDRAILAEVSSYAPGFFELANLFRIKFTVRPTDEFGELIETDEDWVTYEAKFNLDANASDETGTGSYSVSRSSKMDLNNDGKDDALRGDFSYLAERASVFNITLQNLESQLANNGNWDAFRGGGFSMTLEIEEIDGKHHGGSYFILFDDGSNETGDWESSTIREETFSLDIK
jgi:hypothetical protein